MSPLQRAQFLPRRLQHRGTAKPGLSGGESGARSCSPVTPGHTRWRRRGKVRGGPAAGGGASAPVRSLRSPPGCGSGRGGAGAAPGRRQRGGKQRGDAVSRRGRRRVPLGCANSTEPGFISGFALLLCRQRSGMGLHVLIISHRRPSAASSSAAGPGGAGGAQVPPGLHPVPQTGTSSPHAERELPPSAMP